jgi:hypothetical protein
LYVGTKTNHVNGVTGPYSVTVVQGPGDLASVDGVLCHVAPDGAITYAGTGSIGWVPGGGPPDFSVVGGFSGTNLTYTMTAIPHTSNGFDATFVLVKQ